MSFGQPLWFWAFALFPFLLALFFRNEARRSSLLRKIVAARLQERLAGTLSVSRRRMRFALVLLGLAAIIVSLAQPRFGYRWEQSKRKGRDVLIAIDVSKSMLATDLAPNRLERAKLAAQDLISQLAGDRVGLIAFAGSAFLQAPLTADFSAVLNSLNELDTEIIPRGGTNLAEAIRVAQEAFGKGESDHRALIIFSDGEEMDADGVKAAEELKGSVKIFSVGIGSPEGSVIPLPGHGGGTEFVKDENGKIVKSRLDETRLRKIAELTGGFYVHLQNGPSEMNQIVRAGLQKMSEKDIDAKLSRQPIERYQWPLAGGIVLLALAMLINERRRGAGLTGSRAAAIIAALFLPGFSTSGVAAPSPLDLYSAGKYEDAQKEWQKESENHPKSGALAFNLGAAAYKNKDFDTAMRAFSQALASDDAGLRAKAEYNLGNTLFQKGAAKRDSKTLEDALNHYGQALNVAPNDANAQHNRKVTEELLEKLKEQEKQQQKQDQKEEQQKEQSRDQKQPQQQDQKKSEEQNKDGQKNEDQQQQQPPQQGSGKQDQQKNSEQKEQPKPGEDQQPQQSAKSDEKKNQQQSKAQEQSQKDDAAQGKGEQKDGSPAEENAAKPGQRQEGQPAPVPSQPEKKPSGELKANPSSPQDQKSAEEEAAAEDLAAAEGKMTERQAKELLDSLKSEDDRVRLLDPNERKRAGRVSRDW